MTKILEFLLILFVCYLLYFLGYYLYKRSYAIRKISSLKAISDAKIEKIRSPLASYFKLSDKPDITVEIGNRIYLIRFLNGKNSRRFMHFASKEYFVTYSKMRFSIGNFVNLRGRRATVARAPGFLTTGSHSVKILPKLTISDKYLSASDIYGKKLVPVLILNPAPNEISYVTETKTSIKVAFTGDEIYGQKIFTATSFVTYAERVCREEKLFYN